MTIREINKVHSALMREHSIFYADMICRAIQDNTIDEETFANGIEGNILGIQRRCRRIYTKRLGIRMKVLSLLPNK